jgi:hypothetical protein
MRVSGKITSADRRPTLTENQDGWRQIIAERNRRKPPRRLRLLGLAERALLIMVDRTVNGRPRH